MDAVGEGAQKPHGQRRWGLLRSGSGWTSMCFGQQVIEAVAVVAQIAIELCGRSDRAANAVKLGAVVYVRLFLCLQVRGMPVLWH